MARMPFPSPATVRPFLLLASCALILAAGNGCKSLSYKAWEWMGYAKRDLLVDNVEEARDAQNLAKEQFKTTLERFSSVVNFDGGALQEKYDQLKAEYDASEARAKVVSNRIHAVEGVAEALFREWQGEVNEMSNPKDRSTNERMMRDTRQRYDQLIAAMKRAESKMDPVLTTFRDKVLLLKGALNQSAIASLKDELISVESDVAELIREMEASVEEANAFIEGLDPGGDPS